MTGDTTPHRLTLPSIHNAIGVRKKIFGPKIIQQNSASLYPACLKYSQPVQPPESDVSSMARLEFCISLQAVWSWELFRCVGKPVSLSTVLLLQRE